MLCLRQKKVIYLDYLHSWMGQCATSRKVAVSIPVGFIESFHWHKPFGHNGYDPASNRNEYQKYFLGGKGGRCVGLATLPFSYAD
jgi:hypothetical protein